MFDFAEADFDLTAGMAGFVKSVGCVKVPGVDWWYRDEEIVVKGVCFGYLA